MTWELTIAENGGEIPALSVTDEIKVPVSPLDIDIKAQLMIAKPKTLVYTVGWRALVWQNKETGQFKDITDEEYAEYLASGNIGHNPDGESTESVGVSTGDEGTDTNPTTTTA
jgi:hypothetical protein